MGFRSKINILSIILLFASLAVNAQNVDSLLFIGDSLRADYRFHESLQIYDEALNVAMSDSLDIAEKLRERRSLSENGKNMMSFVDSPVVEAKHKFLLEDFFLYYPLPDKSWRQTPNQLDTVGGWLSKAIYFPEASEVVCFSSIDTVGVRNIYISELKDSVWTSPCLMGEGQYALSEEVYPMFSADRKSLYFSSKGLFGVGGYDIYVSRWDDDTRSWGSPMNMGFPYSSLADDFLYATSPDGRHTVFASNRDCSSDSVWVYVLKTQDIPVRREVADSDELKEILKLTPIGYTARMGKKTDVEADIPENIDTRKYLEKITEVRSIQDSIEYYNEKLEVYRNNYALSNDADERLELTTKIIHQESELPLFQEKLDMAKKQLHEIELEFLFKGVVLDPEKLMAQADREVVSEEMGYAFVKKSFGKSLEMNFEAFGHPADSSVVVE